MDVTGERISRILLIQTSFSLVNAAVVCAILESISGLESSFRPFTLIFVLMPLVLFVISLVFSAMISVP